MPGLAARWSVSDDAKTFVFTLRDHVSWHDGSPLTAADVVFTLKSLSDPNIRIRPAADFGTISNITAPDAHTVSITLGEPYCAALTYIGLVNILPQHLLATKDLTALATPDLVGTGPLILRSWNNNTIKFKRNANYWDGAPQIVDWTYTTYPDRLSAENAVRDGHADVLATDAPVANVANIPFTANEYYALALNTGRPPFDDARLRQAVASALDPTEFTTAVNGAVLSTSLLPTSWFMPSDLTPPKFDVASARQSLSAAGWTDTNGDGVVEKNGKPLQVTLWAQVDEPRSQVAAQIARTQLARIGIDPVLKMSDRLLFLTRVFLHEYDLALVHFNIPLDPDQHYYWSSAEDTPGAGLDVTSYSNDRVQAALRAGSAAARCDPTTRKNAYAPVFQQIANDIPMVFLFAPTHAVDTGAPVSGIAPSSYAGAFWNLNTWEVAP